MTICGLCKLPRKLEDSHLIPKSAYRALKMAFEGNDLVMSDSDRRSMFYSDNQVRAHFLCEECEGMLNRYGENVVIPECFKGTNEFDLLDKIKKSVRYSLVAGEKWINPKMEEHLCWEEYLYFAASVFWRASAWPRDIGKYRRALGVKYQEEFRRFLLGEEGFPENAYLGVYADNAKEKYPIMAFPSVSKKEGYHHHVFYLPGVKFSLVVGSNVGGVRKMSVAGNTKIFFIEYEFNKHPDFGLLVNQVKNEYTPRGRLKLDNSNV